jgi:hypothetical protein
VPCGDNFRSNERRAPAKYSASAAASRSLVIADPAGPGFDPALALGKPDVVQAVVVAGNQDLSIGLSMQR